MRYKFLLLSLCVSAMLLVSCEPMYNTGTYYYSYFLVNGTTSQIDLKWDKGHCSINPNDTIVFHHYCSSDKGDDLFSMHRPTLEDGYEGQIDVQYCTILYHDSIYNIDSNQHHSFLWCANYTGYQHPQSVFVYEYYFTIDESYVVTLRQ